VRVDISGLAQQRSAQDVVAKLSPSVGPDVMTKVARNLGLQGGLQKTSTAIISVPAIGDVSHRQSAPWTRHLQYKATVQTSVHKRKGSKVLWYLSNGIIPKKVWLKFELRTNTPPPYEIVWQVVNTGTEAAQAGQLRGTFERGGGSHDRFRWETTAYRGTHWVEGFVIKNGVLIANTGVVLVKVR